MKKFGFSRSKDKGEKGEKSSSPANGNPYAAQSTNDPYTSAPPAYSGSSDSYRQEKTPVPAGGYGGGQADRYAPGAASGGYGSSRYGAAPDADQAPAPSRYGNSGYGGFGGGAPDAASRYGGEAGSGQPAQPSRYGGGPASGQPVQPSRYGGGPAEGGLPAQPSRYDQQPSRYGQQSAMATGAEQDSAPQSDWQSGTGPAYGTNQGYGAYEDRQLTAEEQEEEDILAAKQEIKFLKQSDVSSTRNALRIAAQAEETGRSTLERLGAQGERIHNTERNLDLASNQNRLAAEKAREIKTLNRSMFAVHVANPFTSGKRVQEREQEVLRLAKEDRERRDATRAAAWSSNARQGEAAKELGRGGMRGAPKGSLADRAKYQFEADSEDEAMEEEIDANIDLLHGAAGRLGGLARAMGQEVDSQNKHIERIGGKVDKVDDEIALNRNRLDRIH